MVKRILSAVIAALTSPFSLAFYAMLLVAIGLGVGWFVALRMDQAEQRRKAAERAALRGPEPPQRVPDPPPGDNPFEPRYISLGDEILSNLPGRRRALMTEIDLMTQRGPQAEDKLRTHRLRLRALAIAVLSELTVEDATRPDAPQLIAERLKRALNDELRPESFGVNLVDQVLVKRLFVQ